MNSEILKMAIPVLKPLFIVVSVWLLIRGHNYPGGGFIAGLIAGSSFVLEYLAFDSSVLTRGRKNQAMVFVIVGMVFILASAVTGLVVSDYVMEGLWTRIHISELEFNLRIGTPLLFNFGIYFSVTGFIHIVFTSMMEEWIWK
ncbi:MAG: MnhB domain-containing protein [Bacteroidales bacterium]